MARIRVHCPHCASTALLAPEQVLLGARVTVSADPGRPDTGRRELTATP